MRILLAFLLAFAARANPPFNALLSQTWAPPTTSNLALWLDAQLETAYADAASLSAEKRALLNVMAATAPFIGAVQVWDYDIETNPNFPFNKRAELGLALHASEIE